MILISEAGIEDLGVGLEDLEDMTEDLADDMGGLEDEVEDLEGDIEDLEEGVGHLETGSQGLEEIVEDLEVGTEELETEGLEVMTEDFEEGIEDLERIEDWVWVDWSLDELASGPGLMVASFKFVACLGELSVSLVSSTSPPSSLPSPPLRGRVRLPGAHSTCWQSPCSPPPPPPAEVGLTEAAG